MIEINVPADSVKVFKDSISASKFIAKIISDLIRKKSVQEKKTVLGLATGSTPIPLYNELVRLHEEEGLSFKNVIAFNLDEYFPIQPESVHSYNYFMRKHFFDKIDLAQENYFLPRGCIDESEVENHTKEYEKMIQDAGGLDLQILGIGRNGHIGFNEPGSPKDSLTRMVELTQSTKEANAFDFGSADRVPAKAITMGIQTILNARQIILMAWGKSKAEAIQQTIQQPPSVEVPASLLQHHNNVSFVLDEDAASLLPDGYK